MVGLDKQVALINLFLLELDMAKKVETIVTRSRYLIEESLRKLTIML